jgi:hypothetical protein
MFYTKPQLLTVAKAVHAIQANEKPCTSMDGSNPSLISANAYEADE